MSTAIKKADNLRESIFRLEDYVLNNLPPVELEWVHRFTPGMYSREGIVPAGVLVTGAIHKTEHISVFLEGKMVIPDGQGGSEVIEAPRVEICQPGAKRVGVAIERVRWITFHPTDLETVEECEEAFFTNDPDEVPKFLPQGRVIDETGLASLQRSAQYLEDRRDYESLGIPGDLIDHWRTFEVHSGTSKTLKIRASKIHGKGLFTEVPISAGSFVADAVIGGRLMEYSRYCNHSARPNATGRHFENGDIVMVARRNIRAGEEITIDYRENLRGVIMAQEDEG